MPLTYHGAAALPLGSMAARALKVLIINDTAYLHQLPLAGKGIVKVLYEGIYINIGAETCVWKKQRIAEPARRLETLIPRFLVEVGFKHTFEGLAMK